MRRSEDEGWCLEALGGGWPGAQLWGTSAWCLFPRLTCFDWTILLHGPVLCLTTLFLWACFRRPWVFAYYWALSFPIRSSLWFILHGAFRCFFMRLLTVLGGWQRGAASAGLEWVHDNSVPLFPDILAGLLVGFTLLQPLAFVPVFSQLLPEI